MKSKIPVYGTDYMPGDVIFTHEDGNAISEGISYFEYIQEETTFGEAIGDPNEEPGHVVMVISETQGIESSIGGVQVFQLSKYFDDPKCMVVVRRPLCMHSITFDQAQAYGVQQIGKDYGYSEIGGAALAILNPLGRVFPKFFHRLPLPFSVGNKTFFCSQFVAACFKATDQYQGAKIYKDWHITRIFPNILWNHFEWEPLHG